MRDSFLHLFFGKKKNASVRKPTGPTRKTLKLEALEDRHMLSVTFETAIENTYTADTSGTSVNPDLVKHEMIFSADLNNDGKDDILVVDKNSSKVYTYLNNGSSTNALVGYASNPFVPSDGLRLVSRAAVGSLTSDDYVDLITGYTQDDVLYFSVYRGNGSGGFYDVSIGSSYANLQSLLTSQGVTIPSNGTLYILLTDISLADTNGDGHLDMICNVAYDVVLADNTSYASGSINLLFANDGTGSFNTSPTALATDGGMILAAGDLTGTTLPEYAVKTGAQQLTVYLNTGAKSSVSAVNYTMKIEDAFVAQCYKDSTTDGGKMEIITTHTDGTNYFLCVTTVGTSSATIGTYYQLDVVPDHIITGDFNNDGYFDILVSDGEIYQTLLGTSSKTFQSENKVIANGDFETSYVADFDGDGIADVLAVGQRFAWLIPGDTSKSATVVVDFSTYGITPRDIAFGDFNADGKTDFAVLTFTGDEVYVFSNASTSSQAAFSRSTTLTAIGGKQLLVANFDNANGDDLVVYGTDSQMTNPTLQAFLSTGSSGLGSSVKTTSLTKSYDLLVVGEVTNDGYVDIVGIVNGSSSKTTSSYQTLANTASNPGVFSALNSATFGTTTTNPTAAAVGDMNGDGRNDLVILDAGGKQVMILPQSTTSSGLFQVGTNIKSTTVTSASIVVASFSQLSLGDFNGDGLWDVLAGVIDSGGTVQFRILENDPANKGTLLTETNFITVGSFDGVTSSGLSVHVGRLDANGTADVVVVGGNTVKRFINTDKTGADIGTVTLVFRDYNSTVVSTEVVDLSTLANRLSYIDEWSNFWVEIWADTGSAAGISQFTTVLTFNSDVFEVREGSSYIVSGSAFTNFSYTISGGQITISGSVLSSAGTQGDNTNTLLARVSFMPTDVTLDNTGVETGGVLLDFFTNSEYMQPTDNGFALNVTASTLTTTAGLSGNPTAMADDIPLFPVIYDVDDSGKVDISDFPYFVMAFENEVDAAGAPVYVRMFDYDHDGVVNLNDFVCFQQNFRLELSRAACRANPNLKVYYPSNFPESYLENWQSSISGASLRMSLLDIVSEELTNQEMASVTESTALAQTVSVLETQTEALLAYIASQDAKKDDFSIEDLSVLSETERLLAEGKL